MLNDLQGAIFLGAAVYSLLFVVVRLSRLWMYSVFWVVDAAIAVGLTSWLHEEPTVRIVSLFFWFLVCCGVLFWFFLTALWYSFRRRRALGEGKPYSSGWTDMKGEPTLRWLYSDLRCELRRKLGRWMWIPSDSLNLVTADYAAPFRKAPDGLAGRFMARLIAWLPAIIGVLVLFLGYQAAGLKFFLAILATIGVFLPFVLISYLGVRRERSRWGG